MVTTRSSTRKSAGPSPDSSFVLDDANGHGSGNDYANGKSNAKKRAGGAIVEVTEHDSKRQKVAEPVDKTRWRMKADGGRHTWHYLDDDQAAKDWPQSYAEKWYLNLPLVSLLGRSPSNHALADPSLTAIEPARTPQNEPSS